MGAEPGGRGFWWAMLFNTIVTFGPGSGSACAAERVRLTCVCRETRSSCAANGTYGDPGLCVTSPATRSRHPRFPTSPEEFGSPRPHSSAVRFSLVLAGGWASSDLALVVLRVQCWALP